MQAVRGQTQPSQIDGSGSVSVGKRYVDWLIVTEEFVTSAGVPITPIEGARITPENGDGVYEIVTGPSGQCFKHSDGREMRLRIHTDKFSDEA